MHARLVIAAIAVGTVARLAFGFATLGVGYDVNSFELVRATLATNPWHLYPLLNAPPDTPHWPYPPGFLPWVVASDALSDWTGLDFPDLIQVLPIAADAVLAWVVYAVLRGPAGERVAAAGGLLVALGPSFAVISGYHTQIDSVAILPAVLGVLAWARLPPGRRALVAGILIGVGGAIKGVPLAMVAACWPTARSLREAAALTAVAVGVVAAALGPFLAADLGGTIDGLRANRGIPGMGGISLLVQPDLAGFWLGRHDASFTGASELLIDAQPLIAAAALAATAGVALRARLAPLDAAVLIWLALLAFGVNFAFQYLVWALPFMLLAGHVRRVAVLQAWVLVPAVLLYWRGRRDMPVEAAYVPMMLALWAALVTWYVVEIRRRPARGTGTATG